jgi:hypothetical protein
MHASSPQPSVLQVPSQKDPAGHWLSSQHEMGTPTPSWSQAKPSLAEHQRTQRPPTQVEAASHWASDVHTHWPQMLQVRPPAQAPQMPPQPSGPQ